MQDELESLKRQEREKDAGSKDKRTELEKEIRYIGQSRGQS